jgi:H+-transporting ATPase
MAPNDDVERGRASSAADRQKSIVSMTEFEGMDEYTALQKYILFYRDPRSGGHHVEEAPKKKGWQFWKSNKTAAPVASAGEVPDECKFLPPPHHLPSPPSAAAAAIAPR